MSKRNGGRSPAPALPSAHLAIFAYGGLVPETLTCILHTKEDWPELGMESRFEDALIYRMRDRAASYFLEHTEAEVFMMVDHDVIWERGDLQYLAQKCAESRGVVAGIYPKRGMGQDPPVRFHPSVNGKYTFGDDILLPATYLPTGFMAIHRDVLVRFTKDIPYTIGGYWPFFHPRLAEHPAGVEGLSEDYAFTYMALDFGLPVHAAMKLRLQHVGHYIYRMVDANVIPPPDRPVSVNVEGQVQERPLPILDTLPEDIRDATGIPLDRFGTAVNQAKASMAELWQGVTPEQESAWYLRKDIGKRYILDLADWHMRGAIHSLIMEIEEHVPYLEGPVLDYGAGIGTLALHLASKGADVDVYEPNEILRQFISFRSEKHKAPVNINPEFREYALIVCWHVLEHLPEAEQPQVAEKLVSMLAPGGRILSQSDFVKDSMHPFHHEREDNGDGLLEDVGLVRVGPNTWAKAAEVCQKPLASKTS